MEMDTSEYPTQRISQIDTQIIVENTAIACSDVVTKDIQNAVQTQDSLPIHIELDVTDTEEEETDIADDNQFPKFPISNIHRILYDEKSNNLEEAKTKASDKIKQIMDFINDQKSTKVNRYKPLKVEHDEVDKMTVILYRQKQNLKLDPHLKACSINEEVGGANSHIIFYVYHIVTLHKPEILVYIYALTSKRGWQAIQRFSDFEFPLDISNKILNPKGARCYVERTPIGNDSGRETTKRHYEPLNALQKLAVVNSFGSDILHDIKFQNVALTVPRGTWVDVGPGRIKMQQNFDLKELSILFQHLEYLYKNTTANTDAFTSQMLTVDIEQKIELDKKLAEDIVKSVLGDRSCDWVTRLNICDSKFKDFTRSKKGLCLPRTKEPVPLSNNVTIGEILTHVRNYIRDVKTKKFKESLLTTKEYGKFMRGFKLEFVQEGNQKRKPILDFMEGHVYVEDKYFCRMGKMWYYICEDLVLDIELRFRKVIDAHILEQSDDLYLTKKWPVGAEGKLCYEKDYNNQYKGEHNFYVGDCKTPLGIELCDIMKDCETRTALYHVKKEFNQTTRDLCSQIQNSATLLHELATIRVTDGDILRKDKLLSYAKELGLANDKLEQLLGFSQKSSREVVFVMAVQTQKNLTSFPNGPLTPYTKRIGSLSARSLSAESKKKFEISIPELETGLKRVQLKLSDLIPTDRQTVLEALLLLLEKHNFCFNLPDKGTYKITSKLLYVENSNVFDKLVNTGMQLVSKNSRKKVCDNIREILSPWITNFPSLLPKYSVIDLHANFGSKLKWGTDNFKICEILAEVKEPQNSSARKLERDAGSNNSKKSDSTQTKPGPSKRKMAPSP